MGDFNFENRNINITSLPGSPSQDGTDATGVNQPTGGVGIRGWLSGIYNVLKNTSLSMVNKNSSGTEIFTDANAGSVKLTGSIVTGNTQRKLIPTSQPLQLTTPTFDGSGQAVHTNVIRVREKFAGYEYWMGMTPYPNGNPTNEKVSILASNDGINWVVPDGLVNPIVNTFSPDPFLVHDTSTNKLYCYYVRGDGEPLVDLIRRKWSTDGITWSEEENTNIYYLSPSIIKDGNKWILFGMSTVNTYGIIKYTSTDGLTWTNGVDMISDNIGDIWHSSVLADGVGYHFLSAIKEPGQLSAGTMLYYGYSKDAISIEYDATPLLIPADWYNRQVYLSSLVSIGINKHRVYFSGADKDSVWHGGYFDVEMASWGRSDLLYGHIVKPIVLLNNLTIPAGQTVYSDFISLVGTPYVAYSLSANGSKTYEVFEVFLCKT